MAIQLVYVTEGILMVATTKAWQALQAEYPGYVTSLGPWTAAEVAAFLAEEYEGDLAPAAAEQVAAFVAAGGAPQFVTFVRE